MLSLLGIFVTQQAVPASHNARLDVRVNALCPALHLLLVERSGFVLHACAVVLRRQELQDAMRAARPVAIVAVFGIVDLTLST